MKRTVSRNLIIGVLAAAFLSIGVCAFSQQVSPDRHPNLAAAQDFIPGRAHIKISHGAAQAEFLSIPMHHTNFYASGFFS